MECEIVPAVLVGDALRLLEHPKFRAAYDFLLLRAQAGEPGCAALADWWTKAQVGVSLPPPIDGDEADDDGSDAEAPGEAGQPGSGAPKKRRRRGGRRRAEDRRLLVVVAERIVVARQVAIEGTVTDQGRPVAGVVAALLFLGGIYLFWNTVAGQAGIFMPRVYDAAGNPYTNGYVYPAVVGGLTYEADLADALAKTGAFPIAAGTLDAVVMMPFPPGAYTVSVSGAAGTAGNVLVEIYDLDP